jgi:hypothetical protein
MRASTRTRAGHNCRRVGVAVLALLMVAEHGLALGPHCSNSVCNHTNKCREGDSLICRRRTCHYFDNCELPEIRLSGLDFFCPAHPEFDASLDGSNAQQLLQMYGIQPVPPDRLPQCQQHRQGASLLFTDHFFYGRERERGGVR